MCPILFVPNSSLTNQLPEEWMINETKMKKAKSKSKSKKKQSNRGNVRRKAHGGSGGAESYFQEFEETMREYDRGGPLPFCLGGSPRFGSC